MYSQKTNYVYWGLGSLFFCVGGRLGCSCFLCGGFVFGGGGFGVAQQGQDPEVDLFDVVVLVAN